MSANPTKAPAGPRTPRSAPIAASVDEGAALDGAALDEISALWHPNSPGVVSLSIDLSQCESFGRYFPEHVAPLESIVESMIQACSDREVATCMLSSALRRAIESEETLKKAVDTVHAATATLKERRDSIAESVYNGTIDLIDDISFPTHLELARMCATPIPGWLIPHHIVSADPRGNRSIIDRGRLCMMMVVDKKRDLLFEYAEKNLDYKAMRMGAKALEFHTCAAHAGLVDRVEAMKAELMDNEPAPSGTKQTISARDDSVRYRLHHR